MQLSGESNLRIGDENFRADWDRNAVELIVSIIALTQHKVDIVQESLIGSMLSNLLLVMGCCFFFGGINRVEQHFNVTVAQTASSLLAVAIASLVIPAAFEAWAANNGESTSHFPHSAQLWDANLDT